MVLIRNWIANQPHERCPGDVIPRTARLRLERLARQLPVVTVTGPRQSGKTTLCRLSFPDKAYVSLEAPDVRDAAAHDPYRS